MERGDRPGRVVAGSGREVGLDGSVERVTFYNPENGFSVVRLRLRGRRETIAVVGTLPAVQPGETLALTGQWRTDPRHGAQFHPAAAEVRPPSTVEDTIRYLGSGLIRQLGPTLARRIAEHFGDETLPILDAHPGRVREVPGIGPQRASALIAAWEDHRALRAVSAFLSAHGLDTRFAPRLVAAYGQDAPRVLGANPYRLVAEVPGLGFSSADRLGRDLLVRPSAPARLQAAVHAALLRAGEEGHTRQSRAALATAAAALADLTPVDLERAITQPLAGGPIAARGTARVAPQPQVETLPLLALAATPTAPPSSPPPTPKTAGRLR